MKPNIVLLGTSLGEHLRDVVGDQYNLIVVNNMNGALTALRKNQISAILVSHTNSSPHKLEIICELKAAYPDLKVISIGDPKICRTTNALGICDWIRYPIDRNNLLLRLRQICQHSMESAIKFNYGNMIGKSPAMVKVFRTINKIADIDCSVLICGGHGTGKELVAQCLHFKSSRRNHPFIPVCCGALAPTLLESELFGHEKGAFTGACNSSRGRFERAGRGTIFLDEIGELSQSLQVKLLRVLQEREFERVGGHNILKMYARVVASTNRDLEAAVRGGVFREDLYYRLNVINIFLPSLRYRKEDIPLLAYHFVKKYEKTCGRKDVSISNEAMEVLQKYHWPGNVRELEHQIWRAICMCEDNIITPKDFSLGFRGTLLERRRVTLNKTIGELSLLEAVESVEKRMIYDAMEMVNHVKAKAARLLGISERILSYKIKKYDIDFSKRTLEVLH